MRPPTEKLHVLRSAEVEAVAGPERDRGTQRERKVEVGFQGVDRNGVNGRGTFLSSLFLAAFLALGGPLSAVRRHRGPGELVRFKAKDHFAEITVRLVARDTADPVRKRPLTSWPGLTLRPPYRFRRTRTSWKSGYRSRGRGPSFIRWTTSW